MPENTKTLPDIQGSESIARSWRKLLTRDRNVSNLFAGVAFTTDQDPVTDIGRPNWRIDLRRLFIFDGEKFVNLFTLIEPYEISYSIEHPDVPEGVDNLQRIIDLLVRRNNLNTVVLPAEGVSYTADGISSEYALPRFSSNKYSLFIYIDGVKQDTSTYSLSNNGESVIFNVIPRRGENIEIIQNSSLVEWDYSTSVNYFEGDGTTTTFTCDFELLHPNTISVNIDGEELQKNQFTVNGNDLTLSVAPVSGASIQVSTTGRTSFITVSNNSVGTDALQNKSVTASKLADNIPVNVNNIPNGSLNTNLLADGSVTSAKLASNAVIGPKIAGNAVSEDKLATSVSNKLLGTSRVATSHIQDGAITRAKLSSTILSDYYTKTEVDALINGLQAQINELKGE